MIGSGSLAVVARALLQEELRGCFLTLIGGGHEATQLLAQLAASLHVPLQVIESNGLTKQAILSTSDTL